MKVSIICININFCRKKKKKGKEIKRERVKESKRLE